VLVIPATGLEEGAGEDDFGYGEIDDKAGDVDEFIEVMRPVMLVWFVNCLVLIPSERGIFYTGIVWMMVLMMVFEEVMGIRRLQAFCISAAVNFCVFAVQFEMLPVTHHL